jgi:hypothetical protein
VKVQTAFSRAGLKGLRFGKYIGKPGSFSGVVFSPEPGKQDDRFSHFPVLGNGIMSAGLFMTMSVTRNVKQPSGGPMDWRWMRGKDYYSDQLILTENSVVDLKDGWDVNVVYDLQQSEYFSNMPEKHGVNISRFTIGSAPTNHRLWRFPQASWIAK